MAGRKDQIGDVGPSDPVHWIAPFKKPEDLHALLIVAADSPRTLQQKVTEITGTDSFKAGVEIVLNQSGRTRPDLPGHEHFGFKDGVSQPGVRGVVSKKPEQYLTPRVLEPAPAGQIGFARPGQPLIQPGHFVLGY